MCVCVCQEIQREKAAIKELEDQYNSLERLRNMEGEVDLLRQEMLWAFVNKIEMVREHSPCQSWERAAT